MAEIQHTCSYCHQEFSDRVKLTLHVLHLTPKHHDPCVVCDTQIPECVTRKEHLDSHPQCNLCKIHFKCKEFFLLHKIVHHSNNVPNDLYFVTVNERSICYICDLVFADQMLAEIHIRAKHFLLKNIFAKI